MEIQTENIPVSREIIDQHGIKPEEYANIITLLDRHPNINELGMFSVMWSEHCSYKSSKKLLEQFPTCSENVICGPGENAGVIDIGNDIYVVFKVESHNHPTAVEPFHGAATGVGGILRDIFTMGARPLANLNSLRFGNLSSKKNRYLFSSAVAGIGWYGNCVGVPTVGGECYFDECFSANPLVNALTIGIIYDKKIIKSAAKGPGNSVLYVGNTTGRDGMAGATFASRELNTETNKDRPAIQVGDPFTGKLLIESCLEAFQTNFVIACQDMGAAGLTCSMSEMASKGGVGITLDLDLIPTRGDNILPYEYLLSESQERMLLIVKPENEKHIIDIFNKWGLEAVKAGVVTDDKNIVVYHKGKQVVNLPVDILVKNIPDCFLQTKIPEYYIKNKAQDIYNIEDICPENIETVLLKILSSHNICSREWLFNQYDRQVQNNSILHSYHHTGSVIRIRDKNGIPTRKGIAVSMDCNSRYCYLDPYKGAVLAVAESARNIAVTGAKPIAITNNLNFANPEKPEIFWQLSEACKGIKDACEAFNICVTGGNVSLYNESKDIPIYPTPVIGMVGIIDDIDLAITPAFKNAGDLLILIGETGEDISGSEYLYIEHKQISGSLSEVNFRHEISLHEFLIDSNINKLIQSSIDISEGGLLTAICESAIKGNLGVKLNNKILQLTSRIDSSLFGETAGRILITISPEYSDKIKSKLEQYDLKYNIIGKVQAELIEIENSPVKISVQKAKNTWESALPSIMTN
ncbi:MAG: phosphoribosylformylglycinamidine synthase subunit PurL [Cyanobacteriota bacterium]